MFLLVMIEDNNIKTQKVVQSLMSSGLLQPAGIAMTLSNTGQQWYIAYLNSH